MAEKWLKGAINPEHKGYCSPMSKGTCTPHRAALARTLKKYKGWKNLAAKGKK